MRVVGRAVERIDDPTLVARARRAAALFGQNRGVREIREETRNDRALTRAIGDGHDVGPAPFFLDFEWTMGVLEQQCGTFTRSRERGC